MINKLVSTSLIALLLLSADALAARDRVDEKRDASEAGFVRITIVRGQLEVEGWDRKEIQVTGLLDEQTKEFVFDVNKQDAIIEVKLPRKLDNRCCSDGSDLVVKVPRHSTVDISVVSTDIEVSDILGGLEVGSVSGDVRLSNIRERVDATAVSGDIDLHDGSGRISLKSVSGDITAYDSKGDMRLHSVSGDILTRNVSDEFDLQSVSGDIEAYTTSYRRMRGNTVSGDVDVAGEMQPGGSVEFESVSGSVRVKLQGEVNARFDVETGSGSIRNRVSDDRPVASKYARDETLRFIKGKGEGEVIISTRSGDIVLSKD